MIDRLGRLLPVAKGCSQSKAALRGGLQSAKTRPLEGLPEHSFGLGTSQASTEIATQRIMLIPLETKELRYGHL